FLAGCEASIGDNSGKTAAPTANAGNKTGEETVAGGKEAAPTSAAVSATSTPVPTKASATQTPAVQTPAVQTPEPEEPETVRKYGRIYTEELPEGYTQPGYIYLDFDLQTNICEFSFNTYGGTGNEYMVVPFDPDTLRPADGEYNYLGYGPDGAYPPGVVYLEYSETEIKIWHEKGTETESYTLYTYTSDEWRSVRVTPTEAPKQEEKTEHTYTLVSVNGEKAEPSENEFLYVGADISKGSVTIMWPWPTYDTAEVWTADPVKAMQSGSEFTAERTGEMGAFVGNVRVVFSGDEIIMTYDDGTVEVYKIRD
ncbi:MAG: hypothetical protein J6Z46_01730, partial [Lachnospiraceae bacterium]|nr:hypothetical protein [Lachnospiraceae bacterium]